VKLFEQPWPEGEYRLFQLGFHVEDVVAAAERWARVFGVGPFSLLPRRTSTSTYRGSTCEIEVQIAAAQAGPVQIELIHQFDDAPSVYRDLFPADGVGLHQLCTFTEHFDDKRAHFVERGYEVIGEIEAHGHRVAYIDTAADFGFVTEVVASSPAVIAPFARLAEMAATWDGSDPVRILTRDGYRTPDPG
jgi:hypothetical protein